MAQSDELTEHGWESTPKTECVKFFFTNVIANKCGDAVFRVNDITCTNNVVIGVQFDNLHAALSLVEPNLLAVENSQPLAGH
jgi:hypothetical protein